MCAARDTVETLEAKPARLEDEVARLRLAAKAGRDCEEMAVYLSLVGRRAGEIANELLAAHLENCLAERLRNGQGAEALTRYKQTLRRMMAG